VESKQISVRLPEPLWRRVRVKANQEQTTVSEVVRDFLSVWAEKGSGLFEPIEGDDGYQIGGGEWWARTMVLSVPELIGEILARSQIIEEILRLAIAHRAGSSPREIEGTFGVLKGRFKDLYPEEQQLISWLESANESRNEAAHSDVLVAAFIGSILEGGDPIAVERFTRKGIRKSLYVMQDCLVYMLEFATRNELATAFQN